MGLVIHLAILFFCVRHVMTTGRPGQAAAIYAGSFLAIGFLFAILNHFTLLVGAGLAIGFLFNLATGFVFFWLLDRYHGNLLAFCAIIFFAVAISIGIGLLL